jgi:HSP20 family protein
MASAKIWEGKIVGGIKVKVRRVPRHSARPGPILAGSATAGKTIPPKEKLMNALTKWNPFRELEEIQNRLGSMFGRTPLRALGEEKMTVSEWMPLVDIIEDEKEYMIKAELPEVKKEDVKVTVENGTLSITGERKFEKEEKGKKYHRVERAYGSFMRSFTLPEGTTADKVSAEFKDGVLKVHLPKSEEVKPKSIDVKVG